MQLTKKMHGMRVRCKIKGGQIDDAKICYEDVDCEDGKFYICQNKCDGRDSEDKLGYKYSWCVGDGSEVDMDFNGVTDLRPLSNEVRYAQKGDIIVGKDDGFYCKVFERFGDILFTGPDSGTLDNVVTSNEVRGYDTWMELEDRGRIIYQFADGTKPGDYEGEKEESLELTIDQIAEKFGVDHKKVKIKKGDDAISGEGL